MNNFYDKPIKLIIVLLVFLGILTSCLNDNSRSKIKEEPSNKIIKKIRETEFKTVDKFGEIQKGDILSVTITLYNEKGKKSERNFYKTDGSLEKKYVYTYDNKGNRLETKVYYSTGNLNFRYTYNNDEKGNPVEINEFYPDGSLGGRITVRFDDKGNGMEEIHYNPDKSLERRVLYKYDNKSNPIEESGFEKTGKIFYSIINNYEKYDKEGNWLVSKRKSNDLSIIAREIEYYQIK